MMPPTIFTLGLDHDTTEDQKMVSGLFEGIASDVWEEVQLCGPQERNKRGDLFEDQHELPIIDNEELGKSLANVAARLDLGTHGLTELHSTSPWKGPRGSENSMHHNETHQGSYVVTILCATLP
jgi:hypothetical protein